MSSSLELTGLWVGHYLLGGKKYPITADLVQAGQRLSGSMHDGQPDRECSTFEAACEGGLPPGADEQIEAKLREMVPDAPPGPVRYVSHLPAAAVLEGVRRGQTVSFLKTYQGTSFGGFKVGDKLVGFQKKNHAVHYEGQLNSNGLVIEGRWWIDADPAYATPRTEGLFTLRRVEDRETVTEAQASAQRTLGEGVNADDLDTAIAKFTEAIRLQPDFAEAYLHRGDAYENKDDLDHAIADYGEAIRLKPDLAEAYHGRGSAYRAQGQSEKAITDFQRFDELSDPEAVRQLFKKHVPEIADGVVEIKLVARIGGARTKIAVHSANPRIDAVGSCVGLDAMRIKSMVDDLNGERIDVIQWSESLQVIIPNALQPARTEDVFLYPRLGRAIVLVKKDQLPLAIGQRGQNVRLASKLVGWDIELMTTEELNEAIRRAQDWFGEIPGITDELVESCIQEGFLSYEDLTFLDPAELADLAGVTEKQAAAIILFAKKRAEPAEKEKRKQKSQDTPAPAHPWWKFWA
jgi:transcription antitermination factor NusA-like protein